MFCNLYEVDVAHGARALSVVYDTGLVDVIVVEAGQDDVLSVGRDPQASLGALAPNRF